MTLSPGRLNAIRWTARISALAVLLFGLPFYFGYGNPLPFMDPGYTLWDNVWLSVFPLMFLGLALGWRWERLGGYLVVVPVGAGTVLGAHPGAGSGRAHGGAVGGGGLLSGVGVWPE